MKDHDHLWSSNEEMQYHHAEQLALRTNQRLSELPSGMASIGIKAKVLSKVIQFMGHAWFEDEKFVRSNELT